MPENTTTLEKTDESLEGFTPSTVEVLTKGESVVLPYDAIIDEPSGYGINPDLRPVAEIGFSPTGDADAEESQVRFLLATRNHNNQLMPYVIPLGANGRHVGEAYALPGADKESVKIGRTGLYRGKSDTPEHPMPGLENPYASSRHIEVSFEEEGIRVTDLSRNGTIVEFQREPVSIESFDDSETMTLTPKQLEEFRARAGANAQTEQSASAESFDDDDTVELTPAQLMELSDRLRVEAGVDRKIGEQRTEVAEGRANEETGSLRPAEAAPNAATETEEEVEQSEEVAEIDIETEDDQEEEAAPEYMDERELLELHFEDLLEGRDVEDADPSMVAALQRQVQTMERQFANAIRDSNINFVGSEFRESVRRFVDNGAELAALETTVDQAMNALHNYADAARAVANAHDAGGNMEIVESGAGIRYKAALDELNAASSASPFGSLMNGAGEGVQRLFIDLDNELEETSAKVRAERIKAEVPSEQVRERMLTAVQEGGGTIAGLGAQVSSMYPESVTIAADINKVEGMQITLRAALNVVSRGDYSTVGQVFRNELEAVANQVSPGNVQISSADMNHLGVRAEELISMLQTTRQVLAVAKSTTQN